MDPMEVIEWLKKCATEDYEHCKKCPYNKNDYEDGCGKLLKDAAELLSAVYLNNK